MIAVSDANPPIYIKKPLFKKDNEKDSDALLMKLINSTTIPKPQKEKVLLALSDAPNSSSKITSIFEKNLGHKVNKIVPFLSSSSSSTVSTAAPSTIPGAASSSSSAQSTSLQDTTTQPHNTIKRTDLTISQWKTQKRAFLVDQLETHRGVSLTREQKMGGKDKDGKKIKKMTIPELADMIIKIDKITE